MSGYSWKHAGAVSSVVFSSDGKYVATAGFDTNLKVLDMDILEDVFQERSKNIENEESFSKTFFDTTGVRI